MAVRLYKHVSDDIHRTEVRGAQGPERATIDYSLKVFHGNELQLPTAGADPGGRAPAPGRLRLIQGLVNTLSGHTGDDLLGTPGRAARWLADAGQLPPGYPLAAAERQALIDVREAVRAVLGAHTHGLDDPGAARHLSVALMPARLTVTSGPASGLHLASADQDPFARVIGAIAIAIAEATVAGTWPRLKSCPGYRCGWAFYDRSAAGRSRWCSMQVCGARAKMRAYRTRRSASP